MQLVDLPKESDVLKAEVLRLIFASYATDERTFDGKDTFDSLIDVLRSVADILVQIKAEEESNGSY